jgi:gamma-glutamyltranspeptidase/glutathione hydrolase
MAEALGQAFADNLAFCGDPLHVPSPLAGLASKNYAASLAGGIAMDRARPAITPGDPWAFEPAAERASRAAGPGPFAGTTKVCAADEHGNMVSLITSLGSGFGSLVLVPGTGIMLGNAMQWFDPQPGRANSVGPGRMPLYAAPVFLAFRRGNALGAMGASGGYRITTAILHTFVNVVDHGMRLQAALESPRIHAEGQGLEVDSRIPPAVRDELAHRGHRLQVVEETPYAGGFGRAAAVWRDDEGWLHAAAEPHYGGTAGF